MEDSVLDKINAYFIENHKLCLILCWVFFAIAAGIAAFLAIFQVNMGYFKFLGFLIVPTLLAIYFRLMYGKYQEKRRSEEREKRLADKKASIHHKKRR